MQDEMLDRSQAKFKEVFERLSLMSGEQDTTSLQREASSIANDISQLSLEMSIPNQLLNRGKWTVVSDFLAVLEFAEANAIELGKLGFGLNQDGRVSSITSLTYNLVSTEGLHALPHLTSLFLQQSDSLACDHLATLSILKVLSLNYSKPKNFEFLSGIINLQTFEALKTGLSDLSLIAGLVSLENLSIGGNGVTDISPIVHLRNLNNLTIKAENIGDLSPLVELTELVDLKLISLPAQDLSFLLRLPKLQRVSLSNDMIVHDRERACIEALGRAGVVVELS